MTKIGIVLSGGGVRGFAHLGLLKVLDEMGIRPHAISGVSAGAIAGSLYLAGLAPDHVLQIMKKNVYFGWTNLLWNKDGFFSMKPLLQCLQQYIPKDDFEALPARFYVTATDYTDGKEVIFSSGPLHSAIIASATVPVVFEPVRIDNKYLVDGGLLNNFPVEPLRTECDRIIGSHVNKLSNGKTLNPVGKINILEKCFHMAIAGRVEQKAGLCHLFLEPPLHRFSMFDVKKADEIFEIGYTHAAAHKKELEKLMQ